MSSSPAILRPVFWRDTEVEPPSDTATDSFEASAAGPNLQNNYGYWEPPVLLILNILKYF